MYGTYQYEESKDRRNHLDGQGDPVKTRLSVWLLLAALALAGCAHGPAPQPSGRASVAAGATAPAAVRSLRFLGSAVVSRDPSGATRDFGGISGLDWDPVTNTWYLLS